MSDKNYWIKNGILNLIQNFSGVILGFLSFFLLVRVLSKEDYGLWGIFLGIINIVELSKNGFTQEATIKYLSSANRVDKRKITTASFAISIGITLFLSLLIIIFSPYLARLWHAKELVPMLYVSIIMFFVGSILAQINYAEQANLSFRGNVYSSLSRQIILFIYIGTCFLFKLPVTLISLAIVQVVTVIVATGIAYFLSRKYLKFTYRLDKAWLKKIFNFGKYTFGVGLTSVLSGTIDQMMLGSMLSKSASGSFGVAVRITNLADIPVSAMASIAFPQSSLRIEREGPQVIKYLYEKSVGVILSILVPAIIFIYLFADIIIFIIAGDKYHDSIPLLRVIMITCIFFPYGRQTGTMLTASGKTKINFYLMLMNTCVLIVLNFFFIKQFGMIGAAYATLIASVIGFCIGQTVLKKHFNINFINPWKYAIQFYPELYKTFFHKKNR